MTEPVIIFENVTKNYCGKPIVDGLSISVSSGEFVTVLGPSGSGKTTALKMINGLVKPDSGHVITFGENVAECDIVELRRRIGYVVQETALFPHMDVLHNIAYVPNIIGWPKNKAKARAEELIELVNLDKSLLKRYPDGLSGGEKQRVGIARALAAGPEIMLMDEPFGALDNATRTSLQDELVKIKDKYNMTVFFITHDVSEAEKLGSRILIMENGRLADKK